MLMWTNIIELDYLGKNSIVLFKYNWFKVYYEGRGIMKDKYGFIMMDMICKLDIDEPGVLVS